MKSARKKFAHIHSNVQMKKRMKAEFSLLFRSLILICKYKKDSLAYA